MEYSLEPYQEEFVADISEKLKDHKSVIAQLTTGGGKTVVFAALTKQYIDNADKDVIIFVHRIELLQQTIKILDTWHGIEVQAIDAKTNSYFSKKRVYVAMIETFDRRIKNHKEIRLSELMKNVGLVIVDEAHRMEFKKIFDQFNEALRIGFTATPIGARKKDPLKNHYTGIVVGRSIKELIEINKKQPDRGVVPDITYTLENINRNDLAIKGDDFDDNLMGIEFSKMQQIQNTIDAYIKYAYGKKMLCFNANVEHSKKVTEEMCKQGLNAKHLDGNDDGKIRTDRFQWLKNTPDAILCNVGIATTGFDEPSVEGVIINKATKSLTLYKQMCGRSARPYQYPGDEHLKTEHIILDMGDNACAHGVWSEETDWEYLFLNPRIPKDGIAPLKKCPECGCWSAAAARTCKGKIKQEDCGYVFPIKSAEEDTFERDMIRVTDGIDIKNIVVLFKDRSEYSSFYEVIKEVAKSVRSSINGNNVNQTEFEQMCELAHRKVDEWSNLMGEPESEPYKKASKNTLLTELSSLGFVINNKENIMIDSLKMKINQANRERAIAIESKCTPERYEELTKRLVAAEDALKEYEDSLITPEQKAAFKHFEELQTQRSKLNFEFVELQDKMAALDVEVAAAETEARLVWPEKFANIKTIKPYQAISNTLKSNSATSLDAKYIAKYKELALVDKSGAIWIKDVAKFYGIPAANVSHALNDKFKATPEGQKWATDNGVKFGGR